MFLIFILICLLLSSVVVRANNLFSEKVNKTKDEIALPIIMYHSILNHAQHNGSYIVSAHTLENDMRYLKENGYHTVLIKDVVDYVYEGAPLPEKPIVLTFDDGYFNNYTYLLPLLEQYRMKAVISVVGSFTQQFSETGEHNPNYSYLTWDDISLIEKSGKIEIANHTYAMHDSKIRKGCAIKKGESVLDYQKLLFADLTRLQTALSEKSKISAPVTFTYPFGFICEESQEVVEKAGFSASLSCYEHISKITRDKSSLYQLGRFNRPDYLTTEEFMKKIKLDKKGD